MCRNCSGFQEFYHTSQLFILLSSGQTFTYPSDCFFFSFGCVEMIKIDFNKTFLSAILDEEQEYLFQSGPVTRVKSVIVCEVTKAIQTQWDWVCFGLSPYIPTWEQKGAAIIFCPWEKVFDWFLVLELEVNYSAYHEHVCTFAYIHM